MNRRRFLTTATLAGGGLIASPLCRPAFGNAPAVITSAQTRPVIPFGAKSGDITADRAVIWSRSDRAARMYVEYATTASFTNLLRVAGPAALAEADFTGRVELTGLPAGQQIFYRVTFEDLGGGSASEPVTGFFRTAPATRRDVSFVWGGDVAGQGWGINPDIGGMKIFEAMRLRRPDFFIHSGDTIYADSVLEAEVNLGGGRVWKNLVTPEKAKVAETLDEFRGNHRYNLLDDNARRFNLEVPQLVQWDDHDVHNNWYPGQILDDWRYTVRDANLLAARSRQAFLDYHPLRLNAADPDRIYRNYAYGPSLEVFMLDERSYRGPNTENWQKTQSAETAFLGSAQVSWLKTRLAASRATWKVIASDMPIGVVIDDVNGTYEGVANGDGTAHGRELEIADLLRYIKRNRIKNVVFVTADVHYAAAHYYNPARARFTDFAPFWEFVAGPLNAGTFSPNALDNTFGPQLKFISAPTPGNEGLSPLDGMQYFGAVKIDGKTEVMTVGLHNLKGDRLYSVDLSPER